MDESHCEIADSQKGLHRVLRLEIHDVDADRIAAGAIKQIDCFHIRGAATSGKRKTR